MIVIYSMLLLFYVLGIVGRGTLPCVTSGVRPSVPFLTVRFEEVWTQGRGGYEIYCFKCKCDKV